MALEELLNTNKENYLEIDNDPAKPVNDAIEEQQKQMSAHFEAAIQEAYRAEDVKQKQTQQLLNIIGQGTKLTQDIRKTNFINAYQDLREKEQQGKIGNPYEKIEEEEKKLEKEQKKANKTVEGEVNAKEQATDKGEANNGKVLNDTNFNDAIGAYYNSVLEHTNNKRAAAAFVADKFPDFILYSMNKRIPGLPEGMNTLAAVQQSGSPEQMRIAKRFMESTFMRLSELDGVPNHIRRNIVTTKMDEFWKANDARVAEERRNYGLKQHKAKRRRRFSNCFTTAGASTSACVSNMISEFSNQPDGTNTPLGVELAVAELEDMLEKGYITPAMARNSLESGDMLSRTDGKKKKYSEINKVGYSQFDKVITKAENERANDVIKERNKKISTVVEQQITLLDEKAAKGERITPADVTNAVGIARKQLAGMGVTVISEDNVHFQQLQGYWDYKDQNDHDRTSALDLQIATLKNIPNWRQQVNNIEDPETRKTYYDKLLKHHEFVGGKDVLTKFDTRLKGELAGTNYFPKEVDKDIQKSGAYIITQERATADFKEIYINILSRKEEFEGDPFDEATKIVLQRLKNGAYSGNIPSGQNKSATQTRKQLQHMIKNSEDKTQILNSTDALPGEKAALLQALKFKAEGGPQAPLPSYYVELSRSYPYRSADSIINHRLKTLGLVQGSEAKAVELLGDAWTKGGFKLPSENNLNDDETENNLSLEDKKKLLHKSTPARLYNVMLKPENAKVLLPRIQRTRNENNVKGFPSNPLMKPPTLNDKSLDDVINIANSSGISTTWEFGLYGFTAKDFKEFQDAGLVETFEGRVFDKEMQQELMMHKIRLNANKSGDFASLNNSYRKLIKLSRSDAKLVNQVQEASSDVPVHPSNHIDQLIPSAGYSIIIDRPERETASMKDAPLWKLGKWLTTPRGPKTNEGPSVPYTGGGI